MALQANQDYVYVPTIDVNEGLMTGTITKACLVGTKRFLFVVPMEAVHAQGTFMGDTTKWTLDAANPRESVEKLLAQDDLTVEQLREEAKSEALAAAAKDDPWQGRPVRAFDDFQIGVHLRYPEEWEERSREQLPPGPPGQILVAVGEVCD